MRFELRTSHTAKNSLPIELHFKPILQLFVLLIQSGFFSIS